MLQIFAELFIHKKIHAWEDNINVFSKSPINWSVVANADNAYFILLNCRMIKETSMLEPVADISKWYNAYFFNHKNSYW